MGDGSLSQEEIDALLSGADDFGPATVSEEAAPGLTYDEISNLQTLFNEIASSMGITLSTITAKSVEITNPQVEVIDGDKLVSQLAGRLIQVDADFTEGILGKHSYLIPEELARQVAALMMAQEEGELTEMALSALNEGFGQMLFASLNILEGKVGSTIKTSDLQSIIREDPGQIQLPFGSFARVRYDITSDTISSYIDEVFDLRAAKSFAGTAPAEKGVPAQMGKQEPLGTNLFQTGAGQKAQMTGPGMAQTFPQVSVGVQPVQFPSLSSAAQAAQTGNIGLLMDVSMQLTVELGRTKMLIKDILGMGEGTIVELDKLAGEPVDLLVNGKLIAKGEVVVIDENFGVRVTDIISPMERISNLE